MNVNIISGATQELCNQYVFSLLKNRDKSKQHIIISPDRSQFSIEQRLFEETGEKCFFDINVISISRLSKKILVDNKKKILTKQSGIALIKNILLEQKDNLVAFKKATSFWGFATTLFETICFYKSCNISPEQVYVDDSENFANLKQKDIKLVYSEYEKFLQEEYTDSFNQLKLFADAIDKNTFKDTIFYFLEFDDFTSLIYNIILKLARFSDGIYLSCTYGKNNTNSNIYSNKVYFDLIDLFKFEGLDFQIKRVPNYSDNIKSILSENLLAYNPKPCDITSEIKIREFNNKQDEVKFVLADIYSKAILENISFSDFAIVVPSLLDYKSVIIKEINKYGIPYYIDESDTLINNEIIRLLFDILGVVVGDYKLYDFSNVIKSTILDFDFDAVCEYDSFLSRIGAIGDMCLQTDKTKDENIKEFISLIINLRAKLENCFNVSAYLEIINELFKYILTRAENYVDDLSNIDLRIYSQVLNKLENINKDVLSVLAENELQFKQFIEVYKVYFESTNISLPPINSNTIFVADFASSYISPTKYIYIIGSNEGKLPKQKLDNGILSDDELLRLPNSKYLTPTIAMLNSRKTFKLFELTLKYLAELNISYVTSGSDGKLYPNNLINSLVAESNCNVQNCSGNLDVISNNFLQINPSNIIFNNLNKKIATDNLVNYLSDWNVFNNNINYRTMVSTLYNLLDVSTHDIISKSKNCDNIPNLYNTNLFRNDYTSVSQIETFNKCPYQHYVKYGLVLKDNRDNILQPMDIGNIIHEVLSKIVPFILTNNNDIDDIKQKGRGLLEQILKKDYGEIISNHNNTYTIKALYLELDRIIITITQQINNGNFIPKYFEYKFDNILKIDGINIKGFVDRVDICDDGFVVIDYKTGDNKFNNFNDVYSGKKIQLFIYAKAIADKINKKAKGIFYLPISNAFDEDNTYKYSGVMIKSEDNIFDIDRGLVDANYKSGTINLKTTTKGEIYKNNFYKYFCLDENDFEFLFAYITNEVKKSISRIKQGEIKPCPLNDNGTLMCKYCNYKALCNYQGDRENLVKGIDNIEILRERGSKDGELWSKSATTRFFAVKGL